LSFASKVSIATAEGFILFTNSGKKSCAADSPAKNARNTKKRKVVAESLINSDDYSEIIRLQKEKASDEDWMKVYRVAVRRIKQNILRISRGKDRFPAT
jgi:hypothetical protein